jgi:hypothetical protein
MMQNSLFGTLSSLDVEMSPVNMLNPKWARGEDALVRSHFKGKSKMVLFDSVYIQLG